MPPTFQLLVTKAVSLPVPERRSTTRGMPWRCGDGNTAEHDWPAHDHQSREAQTSMTAMPSHATPIRKGKALPAVPWGVAAPRHIWASRPKATTSPDQNTSRAHCR
ncbi:hypothetical protein LMG31506_04110 [Cupriavidus yeoncheonensis]|uniref:Uncharacterized protein n=1 Tax=Cupriavidus yeoncheonensis TaxID=1462994 RepID=A0A916IWK7_9BURK|nr:hypothetical protein LMG31506_04110 [Cupriavidus yeoncheonensis]